MVKQDIRPQEAVASHPVADQAGAFVPLNAFPAHWQATHVGTLGSISGGGTPSTHVPEYWDGTQPWLTPGEATRCEGMFISDTERRITQAGLANTVAKLLPPGTVMMTSRATVGEVVINQTPMATNQGFINVVCDGSRVYNQFLAYWIKSNKQVLVDRAHGVTFKEITKSNFKTVPIVLPPLPEQRAIARVLRCVQGAVQARRRELELERERKAALMQQLFTKGTRGEPTKQTEIGEMSESWRLMRLGDVMQSMQYGLSVRGEPTGPYPILRMNNLVDGAVDRTDLQYVNLDAATLGKFRLDPGDVLFNRTNSQDLVGKTSLFDAGDEFVFASYLIRLVPKTDQLRPAYLNAYLNWIAAQQRLRMLASRGVSQSNISASKVAGFVLPLPTADEQRDIAVVLSACDARMKAVSDEVTLLGELFRALLEELMTGQLSALLLVETGAEQPGVEAGAEAEVPA